MLTPNQRATLLKQLRQELDQALGSITRAITTVSEGSSRVDDPIADVRGSMDHAYTLMWILQRNGDFR